MVGRRDDERSSMRRRAETHVSGFEPTVVKLPEGMQMFKVSAAGVKTLDFMPYITGLLNPNCDPGKMHPELSFFTHKNIGIDEDTYVCLAKTFKEPCPICEWRAMQARRPGSDADLIKALEPKERQLWLVYDYAEPDKNIQLWDVSFHLFGKLLDERIGNATEDDGYDWFFHPGKGQMLKVGFAEKSFNGGKFYEARTIDFKNRAEQWPKTILDQLPNLEGMLVKTEYDKLKAVFLQTAEWEPGDAPVARSAPGKGAPAKGAPAGNTEDWGDEAPSETQQPAKAAAKGKPAKAAAPPAEEAPSEDGDWANDPAPATQEAPAAAPKKQAATKAKAAPAATAAPPSDDDWDNDTPAAPAVASKPAKAAAAKPAAAAPPADDNWDS